MASPGLPPPSSIPPHLYQQYITLCIEYWKAFAANNPAATQAAYQQLWQLVRPAAQNPAIWAPLIPLATRALVWAGVAWSEVAALTTALYTFSVEVVAFLLSPEVLIVVAAIIILVLLYWYFYTQWQKQLQQYQALVVITPAMYKAAVNHPLFGPVVPIRTRQLQPGIALAG